ncbi:MAG: hypothetical protein PHD97_12450 [Bacteroidales bacterium]|nr:hypothetical protein [Bacteroidales bacterium]
MIRQLLLFLTTLLFLFSNSFGQTPTKREILTNKWTIDSIIISNKDNKNINKDTLEKNIKLLKKSAYFDFRVDSTVEIKLFDSMLINQGWWTITNQDTFLTVYSKETPAYYGVPTGETEKIFQIKLLQVDKDKSVFEIDNMIFIVRPTRKK